MAACTILALKEIAFTMIVSLSSISADNASFDLATALIECEEKSQCKSKKLNRALRSNALFRDSSRTRTQSAAAD
jgi:hypothetical protein